MSAARQEWSHLGPPTRSPRTVFDWMIAISVLAIALAVATPHLRVALQERDALDALAAVADVQRAAARAAEAGDWVALADSPPGQVSTGLAAYLPESFSFERRGWAIDWDLYEIEGRLSELVVGDRHGAVSVTFEDPHLADRAVDLAGRRVWLRVGNEVTFLVPALGGDRG